MQRIYKILYVLASAWLIGMGLACCQSAQGQAEVNPGYGPGLASMRPGRERPGYQLSYNLLFPKVILP